MESFWNSPDKVNIALRFFQWLAAGSTIITLIFGMRYSTLKDKAADDAKQEIAELKKKTTPKPLDVRLRNLFNETDPRILESLKQGQTKLKLVLSEEHHAILLRYISEKSDVKYVHIESDQAAFGEKGPFYFTHIVLYPKLITEHKK